jgi:hypothetical protein
MERKEYRTWRIIILVLNILIHLSIFLSLSDFSISDLKKHYPSYFEFSSFSEGKGNTPSVASSPISKVEKAEKPEEKDDIKQLSDPQKVFRVADGGAQVFNDSAQNKNRGDSVNSKNNSTDGFANDTAGINNLLASQTGTGIGDGTGNGTNANIQMPRFMNGDYHGFGNWVYNRYTLFSENFSGSVIVELRIDRNGNIKNINIPDCDNRKIKAELIRIISSSPRWEPAKNRNRPQELEFKMVFNFYGK